MMVAVGYNNRVDKGAPADRAHEIAVIRRHIVECSKVDDSFLHLGFSHGLIDCLVTFKKEGTKHSVQGNLQLEGASCSHHPGFGALAGPAFGACLPLPLPIQNLPFSSR